jgi:hypothetical protein
MAAYEFFGNEADVLPITVEPVVWLTLEERRKELWDIARERILGDRCVPDTGNQPTGGVCNAEASDEISDRISAQDEASTHLRRRTRHKRAEDEQTSDETLRSGAEQKIIRLGVRERVVDLSQTLAATMIVAQKGVDQAREKITSKTNARRGGSRGLLHPGSLIPQRVEETGKLGPAKTVVLRQSGEHNSGSRVIA